MFDLSSGFQLFCNFKLYIKKSKLQGLFSFVKDDIFPVLQSRISLKVVAAAF